MLSCEKDVSVRQPGCGVTGHCRSSLSSRRRIRYIEKDLHQNIYLKTCFSLRTSSKRPPRQVCRKCRTMSRRYLGLCASVLVLVLSRKCLLEISTPHVLISSAQLHTYTGSQKDVSPNARATHLLRILIMNALAYICGCASIYTPHLVSLQSSVRPCDTRADHLSA